ncbi:CPBP family intramembrane glutamic endopeptidase [Fredinandcohnia sp. 179-A 10B2 NHS]|uniref:CPBP family intramembrane glutamic endopeptidase n=1 Tax=Fredinandcohnia sp. 179-A 10B2 NHS TaxID=3235176 RepID=UPI0039A1AB88
MKKTILIFLTQFIILSLYFNLFPFILPMNDVFRFFHIILFFPIAYFVARVFSKGDIRIYGVVFYKGWGKNSLIGFIIGAFFWTILFGSYIALGKYEILGFKSINESVFPMFAVLFGFGTGSLINDMLTRGLVFHHFKDKLSVPTVFVISILLYAFDDVWYAGFSIQNTIFSIVLGLSLTYVFYKTNSIWVNTGIHFGLNVVYGLFYGVSGKPGDGIFMFKETSTDVWFGWLSSLISIGILVAVLMTTRYYTVYKK